MWIKFRDMLPPEDQNVLVSYASGWISIETLLIERLYTDVFSDGPYMEDCQGCLCPISDYIDWCWWTPLPEPPNECRKGGEKKR